MKSTNKTDHEKYSVLIPLRVLIFKKSPITVLCSEEGLFRATDVCLALGFSDVEAALRNVSDENKISLLAKSNRGDQRFMFLSDTAVIELTFLSNAPDAKDFSRWITDDVLPNLPELDDIEAPVGDDCWNFVEYERFWGASRAAFNLGEVSKILSRRFSKRISKYRLCAWLIMHNWFAWNCEGEDLSPNCSRVEAGFFCQQSEKDKIASIEMTPKSVHEIIRVINKPGGLQEIMDLEVLEAVKVVTQ